jgi:hypothetical protein
VKRGAEGPRRKVGRPLNRRRAYYIRRFGDSSLPSWRKLLTWDFMDQLHRCKDDDAKRVLLGIGEPMADKDRTELEKKLRNERIRREKKKVRWMESPSKVEKLMKLAGAA